MFFCEWWSIRAGLVCVFGVRCGATLQIVALFSHPTSLPSAFAHRAMTWMMHAHIHQNRSHQTCFDRILSEVAKINASFVQGSGIGPSSYDVAASDLRVLHQGNLMLKHADDSDLVVPASNSDTVESELNHVEAWASDNNLNLNRGKSFEIIFFSGRARNRPDIPTIPAIPRVKCAKILGVMISDDFLFESHLTETLCSSSQSLHALRVLKSQGMSQPLLRTVFKATALAKLLYCSSVWWGFTRVCDRKRLEAFLRRAIRAGYYDEDDLTFSELCERNDKKLFLKVTANDEHILHQLLPEVGDRSYNLRDRNTKFKLPSKNNYKAECNFITRMIYKIRFS